MTQLVFRDSLERAKLNALLSFLKTWGVDAEITHTPAKAASTRDVFANTRGMWTDYEVDIKQIRKQNRERRTKIPA
jgi:hypothetical protein